MKSLMRGSGVSVLLLALAGCGTSVPPADIVDAEGQVVTGGETRAVVGQVFKASAEGHYEQWEWVLAQGPIRNIWQDEVYTNTFTEPGDYELTLAGWRDGMWSAPVSVTVKVAPASPTIVVTPSVIFLDGKLLINGVEWDPSKSILIGLGSWTLDCSGLVGGDFDPSRVIIIGPDGVARYGLVTSITFDHGGTYQVILKIWDRNLGRYVTKVFTFVITSSPAECPIVSVGLEFHPETRTLTWTTANATTLTASGSWSGNKSLTERSAVIADNGTYVLKGTNACGNEATTTLVVTNFPVPPVPTPTVDLKVNGQDGPVQVTAASNNLATVTLSWGSSDASAITASAMPNVAGWNGSVGLQGVTTPLAQVLAPGTYVFRLDAVGPGGTASDVVTVVVNPYVTPPPPGVLKVTILWSSSTLSNNLKGPEANVGDTISYTVQVRVENGNGQTLYLHFLPYDAGLTAGAAIKNIPFTATTGDQSVVVGDLLRKQTNLATSYFQVWQEATGIPLTPVEGVSVTVFP